jgi:glycosyltransferase involved in cell wall biosynthesis
MRPPLEVLIVSRCLPWPLHYGDRTRVGQLLAALSARGLACDVVAVAGAGDGAEVVAQSRAFGRELVVVPEIRRPAWRYVSRLLRPFPPTAAASWNPEMWTAVERRLRSRRYDVVHLFGGIQVYELRALVTTGDGGLPSVIEPYESFSLLLERTLADAGTLVDRLRLRASLAMARRYERFMFGGYDRVVVLGQHDRDALLRLAPGLPVEVVPCAVRDPDVRRQPTHPPEVVFVGNFSYPPNVRAATILVRELLPALRRHRRDVRVALVGADPPPAIRELAAPGIEVTGFVPSIDPWLARAAAFVAPITVGAGVKNKVVEAMAAGCPVVTTPLGCEGLAATDGEHVLLGRTAPELAGAVSRVIDDPALAERLGRAARELVRAHHSWPRVAAQYEQLYRTVIAERSGRRR